MCSVDNEGCGLEARVARTMRERRMLRPGDTILVAVSGGADSVALLLILSALRGPLGFTLVAAHYEHGIRARASGEDAAFVRGLCGAMGIACHVGHGDVPALAKAWRTSLEDAARRARYAFLEETARGCGAARVALAHQLEDQAETLLLHLAHGAGVEGLAGMRPVRDIYIRPLLEVPRAALEDYLRARGQDWREDATNASTEHARNYLRHEVMPLLRRLNPRVEEALARTAGICAEAADALAQRAQDALRGRVKRLHYGGFWLAEDAPCDAQLVRAFARMLGLPELDAGQTRRVAALPPGGKENLPGGWRALRTARRLHLMDGGTADRPPIDPGMLIRRDGDGTLGDGIHTQAVDARALQGAVLRYRLPGDVFALPGGGTQRLKQTLRDAGVDRPLRDLVPLLARGERVLWIIGVRPSADALVRADSPHTALLTYAGVLPWEMLETDA